MKIKQDPDAGIAEAQFGNNLYKALDFASLYGLKIRFALISGDRRSLLKASRWIF